MRRLEDLPHSFVELYRAGRLDYWTAPYESLTDLDRERLIKERLPKVLWWRGIEWDRTIEEILARRDGGLRPGVVPFAGDGYGNLYCWYPPWTDDAGEPPVVFITHDGIDSGLFARSFIECACRCLVREHADWNESNEADSPHPREFLWQAHLGILRPHLTDELARLLEGDGQVPSSSDCAAIEDELARRIGERPLLGFTMTVH